MKEIKAFIDPSRIADVVRALENAGFRHRSVIDVKGILKALDKRAHEYSVEIGEKVVTEIKLEVVCENDARTAEATGIIQQNADTGQQEAGWIYVSDIEKALPIGNSARA